jgi:hypothetical protein
MKTFREFIAEATDLETTRQQSADRLNQRREIAKQRSRNVVDSFKEKSKSNAERHKAIASAAQERVKADSERSAEKRKA